MQFRFSAISEPTQPGQKWQNLFNTYWPAYRSWIKKSAAKAPDLKTSQAALKKYMPEMWDTYSKICGLINSDPEAMRFLTGFQPPPSINGCSQAVLSGNAIQLVRNYDYHPDLLEGVQLFTAWNNKKVIATSDCLIGALDGMNEDGLAVSLTFGGRKSLGTGFGISFILRYVLEFCSNVEEAVSALCYIPSHMSYNVTVVDRSGTFKTLQLSPDKEPVITNAVFATNHQGDIDWPENAFFNRTIERAAFLENIFAEETDAKNIIGAFLKPPLYSNRFSEGFGTLFTAIYGPEDGSVQLRWPENSLRQTFEGFQETEKLMCFEEVNQKSGLPGKRGQAKLTRENHEMLMDHV